MIRCPALHDPANHHTQCFLDPDHDVPALVAAIESVLVMHKRVGSWRPGVYQCGQCAELCHSTSGLGCEDPIDAVWPCPTVTAIQSALGEVAS